MSQNRADTVVVNDTQSLTNVSGVDPVTSSHCARDGPPTIYVDDTRERKEVDDVMVYILSLSINFLFYYLKKKMFTRNDRDK